MNHTFICTRTENNVQLDAFIFPLTELDSYPVSKVHVKVGAESIFQGYSELLEEVRPKSNDTVVLCHDDIFFVTDPILAYHKINAGLAKPDVGFVGVAGTSCLGQDLVWWTDKRYLKGTVFHGNSDSNMIPHYYGPPGEVVCLDGLFLACKAGLLYSLKLSQPDFFTGGWDFYDILWTLQARMSHKKRNYVLPILICHNSPGKGIFNDSWKDNRMALAKKLTGKLPIVC